MVENLSFESEDNEFASLSLPKTFDLELAQQLVESGWIQNIEDIYQAPKEGEREAFEARRADLLKREEEIKAQHPDDCDIDILPLP